MATYYKVLGQAATSQQDVTVSYKEIEDNVVTLTTSTDHKIIVGQPVTVFEEDQVADLTTWESAGDGTAVFTASAAHRILVGQNVTFASTDSEYSTYIDGIVGSVTAVTSTTFTVSNAAFNASTASVSITDTTGSYSDLAFNGTFIVESDPSSTTFTYAYTSADLSETAASGFTATSVPWEVVYTCPQNIATIISNINICNMTELVARYSIAISDSMNLDNSNVLFWNDIIDSYDTVQITGGYTLDQTNKYLFIGGDVENLAISVFGSEVDS